MLKQKEICRRETEVKLKESGGETENICGNEEDVLFQECKSWCENGVV